MPDNLEVQMRELILSKQALVFTCLYYKSFENTVGKGEIARNEQFLLFPQFFFTCLQNFLPLSLNLKLSSGNSFSLGNGQPFTSQKCVLMTLTKKAFKNTMREKCWQPKFSSFLTILS